MLWRGPRWRRVALLKVVVDANGAGGATTGTGAEAGTGTGIDAATTAGTGSGGGGGCQALMGDFQAKLAAAEACNPTLDVLQCTGAQTVEDSCNCPVVAGLNAGAIQASQAAHDAWVAAGCGPFLCDHCPPDPTSAWHCDETTLKCAPSFTR